MDRIRQALDKARDARVEAPGNALGVPPASRRFASLRSAPGGAPSSSERAEGDARPPVQPDLPAHVYDPEPGVLERHRVVLHDGDSAAADVFKMLRTAVLRHMGEHGWRTIGVASARRGDGRTTLAANLAVAIARSPQHTAMLVDLDLRRPAIATVFGLDAEAGVDDVLGGSKGIPESLYRPRSIERLVLLPARNPVRFSSELVAKPDCESLLHEVRERYPDRIVVVDLPPVLEMDDANCVSSYLDCVLMVVAEGRTRREDVGRTLDILKQVPVVGTVLNHSSEPRPLELR